jgi:hypothetical protein
MNWFSSRAIASVLCLSLAACATPQAVPHARTLSQAHIGQLGQTPVSITGNEGGVGKSWYYTEVNGAGAGLAGAIGGAIASAIINAAPSARAHRQASEIAEVVTPETLNQSIAAAFWAVAQPPRSGAVTFSEVGLSQKLVAPGELDDVFEIATTYTLSEDSSVLRIVGVATYQNAALPYRTPHTFENKPPAAETKGPLYRNTFTYYSTPLPLPVLSPELKERLVASVTESARDETGAPPAAGTGEYRSMMREVELARDDKLSVGESSLFLTREWLQDGGARLMREIQTAHAFIATYALLDINRAVVPSIAGVDELLETTTDDRTVRRIGSGVEAGSYVSSAANVTEAATYGNAVAAGKATLEYVRGLKRETRAN